MLMSAAGIGAGGRTGLTALVVAICFAISSFFSPLLAIVPTAATAPILIIVGIMMLASLKNIHWDDMSEAFLLSSHLSLWDSATLSLKGLQLVS